MGTNTPPYPLPPPPAGKGVPAWKMGLGERESWPRGLIDLFLVIKGIIWLSWGIRASCCWRSHGADSAQEGRSQWVPLPSLGRGDRTTVSEMLSFLA